MFYNTWENNNLFKILIVFILPQNKNILRHQKSNFIECVTFKIIKTSKTIFEWKQSSRFMKISKFDLTEY